MKTVCKVNQCTGCSACVEVCAHNAISMVDTIFEYNAIIDPQKCVDCGLCHSTCPNNSPVQAEEPLFWKQGWVIDENERLKSSSGGFGTAIMKGFVNKGGIVWSCKFYNGQFLFEKAEKEMEVEKFTGSKYVKSSPHGIYREIRKSLKDGKKVLFLGLPCQVAGIRNFMRGCSEQLYTIDLICHGSPSPKILDEFLKSDFNIKLSTLSDIQFREKGNFNVRKSYKELVRKGMRDRYTMAFLESINFTENCYSCNYAKQQRISDLTIGDSWGSTLPEEEKEKGISLVLCQTVKGEELLSMAELYLTNVDKEKALEINDQLREPVKRPNRYFEFRKQYKKKGFLRTVNHIYRKYYVKQTIKSVLIKIGIIKMGNVTESYHISINKASNDEAV